MNTPQLVRHGEVILKPSVLPKSAVLKSENKEVIVAHSETGHHHVLTAPDMSKIKVYMHNGDTYVEVPEISNLWHQKGGSDVHKTHVIQPAVYKLVLKKEFNYYKGALERVRD